MTIRFKSNLACGIFAILLCIALLILIPMEIGVETTVSFGITSRTIPYGVAALIGICGIVLIVKSLVFKQDETKEIVLKKEVPAVLMVATLIAYLFVFEKEWPLSTAVLGCVSLALAKCKKWYYYLIVVALTVILYFVFVEVLYIRLHSVIFGS